MTIGFKSAYLKLRRARGLLGELYQQDELFWNRYNKDHGIVYRDPQGKFRLALILASPTEYISCIVGDLVHNLRSALDHVVIELIETNGGTPNRNSAFPIGSNSANFAHNVQVKTRGASAEAVALIQSFEADATPNGLIWGLHNLDIIDKHKTIVTAGMLYEIKEIGIRYGGRYIALPVTKVGHDVPNTSFELPVPADAPESGIEVDPRLNANKSIVFGKDQPFAGESVLAIADNMVLRVENMLSRFSNSFMRMMEL